MPTASVATRAPAVRAPASTAAPVLPPRRVPLLPLLRPRSLRPLQILLLSELCFPHELKTPGGGDIPLPPETCMLPGRRYSASLCSTCMVGRMPFWKRSNTPRGSSGVSLRAA